MRNILLFSTVRFPAVSSAFEASRGRCVRTTDAAIVSGASVVSCSSGIRSSEVLAIVSDGRSSRMLRAALRWYTGVKA